MKFSKIDSSYLKKGYRLVWHDPVNSMWVAGTHSMLCTIQAQGHMTFYGK